MHRGFIKIWRKIEDWEWLDEPNTLALLFHCTFLANWKDKKWHGIDVKRGSFITSISHLSKKSGLSHRQVRTSLERLISTSEVTKNTTNKYTLISINNYDLYQDNDTPDDKQTTNKRQAIDKQTTTTKEYKNDKNINIYANEANSFLQEFNRLRGTQYKTTTPWIANFTFWLKTYTLEQMGEAVFNAQHDNFWKDKITPAKLFRTKNKNGDCDNIGDLLNTRSHS